jgi:hypothetical protein
MLLHIQGDQYQCNRWWNLSDSQLLAFFNASFPQRLPCQLSQFRKPIHSALTWALSTRGSTLVLPYNIPKQLETVRSIGICSAWKPYLRTWEDPTPLLQVFAERYHDGWLPPPQESRASSHSGGRYPCSDACKLQIPPWTHARTPSIA